MTKRFWDWIDSRVIVRRIVLFVTLYITWDAYQWAKIYADEHSSMPSIEMAAIMAAVTLPISGLQKWVFDRYSAGRKEKTEEAQ